MGVSPCSTADPPPLALDHTSSSSTALPSNPGTVEGIRVVCSVFSCTYRRGEECIRCEQDREYETSRTDDRGRTCFTGDPPPLALDQTSSSSTALPSNPGTVEGKRVLCSVCSCTYLEGEECIRCEQDREYETSRIAHGGGPCSTGDPIPLTIEEMRSRRIALLSNPGMTEREPGNGELSDNLIISPGPRNEQSTYHDQDFVEQGTSSLLDLRPERLCTVHRSCIKTDLIEHFKDPSVMNYNIDFKIINEWGELELRVGTGVIPEVYTLFWNEFSIPMTIGERERVPFVRYDHFVEEWEFVGRILVKRFESVSYFPTFLSKSFLCYCLFGNQVPDSIFIDSFSKYLSPLEEELILDVIRKNELPDNKDELNDSLER